MRLTGDLAGAGIVSLAPPGCGGGTEEGWRNEGAAAAAERAISNKRVMGPCCGAA
eukprot:COSAG04_NODE_2985_length_3317_cov_4.375699_1_plen_55_part_00